MKIARALFLLLLLANLLLFAAGRGYFGSGPGGEPERLANQLNAQKIIIIRDGSPSAESGAAPQATGAAQAQPVVEPKPAVEACRRFAPLPRDRAGRIAEMARSKEDKIRTVQKSLEEANSWWVYLPPQPSRQEVSSRVEELRAAGVKDFFVVQQEGPNHYALSLGLFKSESMAKDLLNRLRVKGISGARVAARGNVATKVSLEVRGAEAEVAALAGQVAAAFPELSAQACAP